MSWYHEIEQNQDAEIGEMRALRIKLKYATLPKDNFYTNLYFASGQLPKFKFKLSDVYITFNNLIAYKIRLPTSKFTTCTNI